MVVDYARFKRLEVPDEPRYSFTTKVYIVLIVACIAFLFKRWRDKKSSSSRIEPDSAIVYPLEPNGL
jgi:hypothetical protein